MRSLARTIGAVLLGLASLAAHAETYPARAIRLIVPYAPGQGTDIAARYIGDELAKELKQSVFVDNRAGAGGNIGTQAAAKSAPDGYTLLIGTNATHAANAHLYASPGFDAQADFEAIGMLGILPLVWVALPASTATSVPDLIRMAKAKPDALNVALSTTTCRMAYELLRQRAEVALFPVDYKGSAQAVTALIGGQIEFMVDTITSLRSFIASQQVKALGVTSARSSRLLPGVRSVAEQGVADYELVGWTVLYAPKGLPAEVSRTLVAAFNRVVARPEVQDRLLQMGIEPQAKAGDELNRFLAAERTKWERLIKSAGLKPA
ncbi:MAG: tripartite tricarboxylate transporter substrate binding protein [Rubrivivax sp.]|jgi:tripartite-type tricarboxylate transporter receptor subunit TctC|nr:tripartite tricarboxylate transporter substrate binding protein [Rubrivivax sp.]MCL4699015.1 tripartite tricarboxylate transporter substrate binding protein [Burkholderiaceae bacterium]